jgi:hypothetical protein
MPKGCQGERGCGKSVLRLASGSRGFHLEFITVPVAGGPSSADLSAIGWATAEAFWDLKRAEECHVLRYISSLTGGGAAFFQASFVI